MAYTQAQLTAVEAAIASGVLTVRHREKTVTYQSMKELVALRAIMRRELGLTRRPRAGVAVTSKGL